MSMNLDFIIFFIILLCAVTEQPNVLCERLSSLTNGIYDAVTSCVFAHVWHLCVMPKKNLNFSTRFVRAMGNLYITACHLQMDIQKIATAASYELRTKYHKCTYMHAGTFFFSNFFPCFCTVTWSISRFDVTIFNNWKTTKKNKLTILSHIHGRLTWSFSS